MHDVISLAYLGFRGDTSAWRTFAVDVHGMHPVMDGNILRLRMDGKAWRIQVDPEGKPGCAFVGFEWETPAKLDAVIARAKAAGYDIVEDPELASKRQVRRLARLVGPGNLNCEFCFGQIGTSLPFCSATGATFVTGGLGMGHIGLIAADAEAACVFFQDVMGLRLTDSVLSIRRAGAIVTFMRGSSRHHLVVVVPGTEQTQGLDHFYAEVDQISTLGRAWDKVSGGAAPVFLTLGQHSNDPAVSYYCVSPSGINFEYGWNSLMLDDEKWKPLFLTGGDHWGHQRRPAPGA